MSRGKKLTGMMVFLNIYHLAAHTALGLEYDLLAGSQGFSLAQPLLALTLPFLGYQSHTKSCHSCPLQLRGFCLELPLPPHLVPST